MHRHVLALTKWLPFCNWYFFFQIHFLNGNCWILIQISLFNLRVHLTISIGSNNDFRLSRWQAITWSNGYENLWLHMSLSLHEQWSSRLIHMKFPMVISYEFPVKFPINSSSGDISYDFFFIKLSKWSYVKFWMKFHTKYHFMLNSCKISQEMTTGDFIWMNLQLRWIYELGICFNFSLMDFDHYVWVITMIPTLN